MRICSTIYAEIYATNMLEFASKSSKNSEPSSAIVCRWQPQSAAGRHRLPVLRVARCCVSQHRRRVVHRVHPRYHAERRSIGLPSMPKSHGRASGRVFCMRGWYTADNRPHFVPAVPDRARGLLWRVRPLPRRFRAERRSDRLPALSARVCRAQWTLQPMWGGHDSELVAQLQRPKPR